MSGVAIIRYQLANNAALIAVVPATRIVGGDLPLNTVLPAITITSVDSVPTLSVSMRDKFLHTDRVQVTVLVKDTAGSPAGAGYPGLQTLLRLVLAACPNMKGTVAGATVDSVLPGPEGPDFSDPVTSIQSRSRDFFVRYSL